MFDYVAKQQWNMEVSFRSFSLLLCHEPKSDPIPLYDCLVVLEAQQKFWNTEIKVIVLGLVKSLVSM